MKASDYIADFLHRQRVPVVFEMIGGMITHIIDSIHQQGGIRIVSMHHEQAAGFAAEAVGRMSGIPGVALATSGPGATNLVTAIGSCYFDSVPAVFITGQVNTTELSGDLAIRQQGFQETDIVSIVKPITKAAWLVKTAEELPAILEQAFRLAVEGRPGPVLVDIPMDVQRMEVESLRSDFINKKPISAETCEFAKRVFSSLETAQKPLLLAGGGIRSAGVTAKFRELAELLNIPVVCSLMGLDALPTAHPLKVGMIGTYGNRWANQAMMESDFMLVLGSRLDVRQTGADVDGFKGSRQIFHVDCESGQLNNRVTGCDVCCAELSDFMEASLLALSGGTRRKRETWESWIADKIILSPDTEELESCKGINPNRFIHALSAASTKASAILADVGKHQMWAAQSVEINEGQRFLVSGGMGSMGFALPAAIGATLSSGKPVVVVAGDGGMQCNIQELETISLHKLPVKMVVLNNNSLGMVGQFQEEYFESRMQSTIWGYSAPDFEAVAGAYRISAKTIRTPQEIDAAIQWLWEDPSAPALLNVIIDVDTKVFPKTSFGRLLNDMDPRRN
ncbi:MAG: thiamine pyrophosphate-binding protein [Verrucomicrobia bacterium]|nr:thiamine pyrophosphate-binding protein [Verrucomicrobiota bacterium]